MTMARDREPGRQSDVARSLARAFQEKFIEPSATRIEEQEARLNFLQEKLTALEKKTNRLALAQKKTAERVFIALAGLVVTVIALIVLNIH